MFIENFVKMLVPSIAKNSVIEDIDTTIAELQETTLPAYAAAFDAMLFTDKYPIKSDWLKTKTNQFKKAGLSRDLTLMVYIHAVCSELPERLEWLRKQFQTEKGTSIVADGITYQVATMLHLVSSAAFISKYARKFLLMAYSEETPEYLDTASGRLPPPFSKIEIAEIDKQFSGFLTALNVFNVHQSAMMKAVENIPEYIVTPDDPSAPPGVSVNQLEPFALNFIPYQWNPIYHIRMAIIDYQFSRYNAAKAERVALDLRLNALKQAREGNAVDPAIEKTIAETEKRLMTLNRKIAQMEK